MESATKPVITPTNIAESNTGYQGIGNDDITNFLKIPILPTLLD
jgi:hypothetical protein